MVIKTSFPRWLVTCPQIMAWICEWTPGVVQCATCTAVPGNLALSWVSLFPVPFSMHLQTQWSEVGGDPGKQIMVPDHSPCMTLGSDFPSQRFCLPIYKMGLVIPSAFDMHLTYLSYLLLVSPLKCHVPVEQGIFCLVHGCIPAPRMDLQHSKCLVNISQINK